jgi:HK97 family phage major capsid protein
MKSTRQLLDDRIDAARQRLSEAAERAASDVGTPQDHVEAENAISDAVHWIDARSKLLSGGTYRADGSSSWLQDIAARIKFGDRSAERRLKLDAELRSTMSNFGGNVVPQYLLDQVRLSGSSGRPVCDLLRQPLLADGATMTVVRVSTATTAEAQSAENASASADNPASSEIALPVVTVISEATLSMQLLQRAAGNTADTVLAGDLLRALDAEQERLVLNGSGSSGQPTGLLNQSGIGTVSLTSTSAPDLIDAVADAAQESFAATGEPADTVVLSPRRWTRTLAKAGDYSAALSAAVAPTGPVRGQLVGLDVVVSQAVPTTLGASTDQDVIIVCRRSDIVMAESDAEVFPLKDTSNNSALQIDLVGARSFVIGAIRPAGVVKITGAGLVAPYA